MTAKLTTPKSPDGFATAPGGRMGPQSRAILELLRKGRPRNRLDINMILKMDCGRAINRLMGLGYIKKSTHGSATGCYEITGSGRIAMGEVLSSPPPTYAPFINATMQDPYIPAIHNIARIGIARV